MADSSGTWIWFELVVPDVPRGVDFYQETLGWSRAEMPMGDGAYVSLATADGPQAGVIRPPMDGVPAHWLGYLSVADVDAAAAAVTGAGGSVVHGPFDIPTVGRAAVVADPQGAVFCLFHGEGDGSGNPVAFHSMELHAADPAAAAAFYGQALGFEAETMAMPGGDYIVLKSGGVGTCGIIQRPHQTHPPAWLPYAAVADPDATLARAASSGGSVAVAGTDLEGVGRFGVFVDDQGAVLGVIRPAVAG